MTNDVGIYARYSTDMQREASIEDQARVCERLIKDCDWQTYRVYSDQGISGSTHLRPGYQNLLEDARNGRFEIVVAESLDRISHDQEHIAGFHKIMQFLGIRVFTVSEGLISELHIGLKGTMSAPFLKDLADKTRRGLEGRVRQGRSGDGKSYGYRVVKGDERGAREIIPEQAETVQRIFSEFAAGMSPNQIAHGLNNDQIPGPSGQLWRDTTIRGHIKRGTGILNNELYIGRLVWNRQRYVKNPVTGKRVSRRNSVDNEIVHAVPHLRIINDTLWQSVKARQKAIWKVTDADIKPDKTPPYWSQRRAAHILSERSFCSQCGGSIVSVEKDYLACSNARKLKSCLQNRSIRRPALDAVVIDLLKNRLMQSSAVGEFIAAYNNEIKTQQVHVTKQKAKLEKHLRDIELMLAGLYDAIADGLRGAGLQSKLDTLENEKSELLKTLESPTSATVSLHPALADLYKQKINQLADVLKDPKIRIQATLLIRELIERVDLDYNENS
ncbi:recombinase family protein [bacterium]|nr:recombinase family protein [bacterium]